MQLHVERRERNFFSSIGNGVCIYHERVADVVHDEGSECYNGYQEKDVDDMLSLERPIPDAAIELSPGDHASRKRDRPDDQSKQNCNECTCLHRKCKRACFRSTFEDLDGKILRGEVMKFNNRDQC